MTQDEEHLRLLSIFHFVVAGITALLSLLPIFHLVLGLAVLTGEFDIPENRILPAELIGWLFVVVGASLILSGLILAVLIAYAGRALRRHEHYTFCLVVAALSCMVIPFGTVLGVFTIIVLMRESVKQLFLPRSEQAHD